MSTTQSAPVGKPLLMRCLYLARNFRSRPLFRALQRYVRGNVLDVGGWDFVQTAIQKGVPFDRWVTLEPSEAKLPAVDDNRWSFVQGDGCAMKFPAESFDTVLNIQVLEHVFEPIVMVQEIARVLRQGGHAIFLIPQTSVLHMAPRHYYNFTRYWIIEVMERAGLTIVDLQPLGGLWSTIASHLVYFFPKSMGVQGFVTGLPRSAGFFLLLPFMVLYALICLPLCLLLSLGDLPEEANNHLVVVLKP